MVSTPAASSTSAYCLPIPLIRIMSARLHQVRIRRSLTPEAAASCLRPARDTGVIPYPERSKLIVAPVSMRRRFTELIRREAEHARAGRAAGIDAKMNQLQDAEIIRELYDASRAGVPIRLNIRGLCCLRPGVDQLSETVRVFSVVGRFLEHSRVFRFANGGRPEYFIGSADWMKRNLNGRVETAIPVEDLRLQQRLDEILATYDRGNCSVWDCGADGEYVLRAQAAGEPRCEAQEEFIRRASATSGSDTRQRRQVQTA